MSTNEHEQARQEARRNAEQAVREALRDHGSTSPDHERAQQWLASTKRQR